MRQRIFILVRITIVVLSPVPLGCKGFRYSFDKGWCLQTLNFLQTYLICKLDYATHLYLYNQSRVFSFSSLLQLFTQRVQYFVVNRKIISKASFKRSATSKARERVFIYSNFEKQLLKLFQEDQREFHSIKNLQGSLLRITRPYSISSQC